MKQYFICHGCFNKLEINTDIEDAISKSSIEPSEYSDHVVMKGINFIIKCPHCKNFMFECDESIVDIIIKFNKMGYRTTNSCQGHIEYSITNSKIVYYSMPYIQFTMKDKKKMVELLQTCEAVNQSFPHASFDIGVDACTQRPTIRIGVDVMDDTITADIFADHHKEFIDYVNKILDELSSNQTIKGE